MATFFAVLKSAGATVSLRARAADAIRAFKRAAAEDFLRRRQEALVRVLDREALLDFGIEVQEVEEPTSEASHAELISLRAIFSWTRFAK